MMIVEHIHNVFINAISAFFSSSLNSIPKGCPFTAIDLRCGGINPVGTKSGLRRLGSRTSSNEVRVAL